MEEQYIGSYKVLKKIGAGGMAKVYLAVHQDVPNLKVILKILSDPRLGERFKQEADKLALLDGHPNICRIKHFFNHGEDIVIAMEYIDGITLEEKIAAEGKLPLAEALQIISDVLDILDFAHQKGIYHRDIKPGNIMIDKKGQVKIIDFGIAKGKTDPNLTLAGTACGTPTYMAPEQFNPTQDTNYALVDLYAAGTTLFYLLTGEVPFKGENEFAIRDAKLFSDPPKPRSLNPEIPKNVEEIILKSLAKEPAKRFQSAAEMRQAIEAIKIPAAKGVTPPSENVTQQVSLSPPKKSYTKLIIGVVLAIAVIAALGYYFFGTPPPPTVGMLAVNVTPPADIYIDDIQVGTKESAIVTNQEAGRHVVRVFHENAEPQYLYDTVDLVADSVVTVNFDFSPYLPVPKGTLLLTIEPYGKVYLDDSLVEKRASQFRMECDTGTHVVRIENRKATVKVIHDTISVSRDETITREYTFTIKTAPPPSSTPPKTTLVNVVVVSKPRGAYVYIDGKKQKQQTNYTFKLKPGRHIITARLTYGGEERQLVDTIDVKKDIPNKVVFDFEN